jgi:hypothetical protein
MISYFRPGFILKEANRASRRTLVQKPQAVAVS